MKDQVYDRRTLLRLCGTAGALLSTALLAACGAGATSGAGSSGAVTTSAAAGAATATTTAKATVASSTAAAAASSSAPGSKVQLSLWTTWGDKDAVAEQALADAFAKTQSNIAVTVTTVTDGNKFTAAMASGAPPDLLQTWNAAQVATWATSGGVVQLDSLIASGKLDLSTLDRSGLAAGQLFGKQYGMPMLVYTNTLLFWNKSIFQDVGLDPNTAPVTWQDLTTAALKITKKQGDTLTRIGFVPNNGQGGVPAIMWSFGGQLYSDDGKQVTPDNPGVVKCAEYTRQQIVQLGGPALIAAFTKGFGKNENLLYRPDGHADQRRVGTHLRQQVQAGPGLRHRLHALR